MANTREWIKANRGLLGLNLILLVALIASFTKMRWEPLKPWLIWGFVILVVAYIIWKIRSSGGSAEDGAPMPLGDRRLLTGYLLLAGGVIVYMLVSLNSIDFPEPALEPEQPIIQAALQSTPTPTSAPANQRPTAPNPTPAQPSNPAPTPTPTPFLQAVFPHHTLGNKPDEMLTLYGQNFNKDSKVRFDRKETASTFISANLLTAPLQSSHLAAAGSISVDVANGESVSNAITVPITRPRVALNVFFFLYPLITREVQLLLIVLFAGALGSYLHALKSLGDFIGNRTLTASWFWWYITRPFLGMAMAMVFYALLRGGFLAGSPADAKIVSAFGVLTVGALVGMFADKASQKLAEIFDVVFKSPDTRGGKLDAPVIDKLEPDSVLVGTANPLIITIIGTRLGKVTTVRVNGDERKPDKISEKELTFTLRPEDMKKPDQLPIEAVNSDGGVSPSAKLFVSDLAIPRSPTTSPLADAQANKAYTEQITSTGGTEPTKWTLVEAPKWLKIDDTGKLSGTPAATDVKAVNAVMVRVVDEKGASASQSFNLKVNVANGAN
jgi:hypothetical protein